jgi:DNA-binding MarR family transcriptional regulator
MMDRRSSLLAIEAAIARVARTWGAERNGRPRSIRSDVELSALSVVILADLHERGPARVKALASRVDVELSRVSRHVQALANGGHVRMHVDDADRRARIVDVTPSGRHQLHAHAASRYAALDELLRGWDDESLTTFAQLLECFVSGHRV